MGSGGRRGAEGVRCGLGDGLDRLGRRRLASGGSGPARARPSLLDAVMAISASPPSRPVAIRVSSAVVLRSLPSSPRAACSSSLRTPSSAQPASSHAVLQRAAVHQRPLQLERVLDLFARLDPVQRVVGDQRRGAHRQRGADRAVALEHRSQSQKVIAEPVERALALAAHLEAADRPGEGAVGVGTGLQGARQLDQLAGLVLAEAVAAGAGGGGAGGDPPPAVLAGRGEGVGAEADAAALEEAHDADQLAQLVAAPPRRLPPRAARRRRGTAAPRRRGPCPRCASRRSGRRSRRRGRCARRAAAAGGRSTSAGRPPGRSRPRRRRRRGLRRRASRGRCRARSRSSENSVDPSQSAEMKTGEHPFGALARIGGHGLAARLQVGGGDAGLDGGLAGRAEAGQRAQLLGALLDEARGQRHVAVEGRVVAALGGDVEGDLVAAGDEGAEAASRPRWPAASALR